MANCVERSRARRDRKAAALPGSGGRDFRHVVFDPMERGFMAFNHTTAARNPARRNTALPDARQPMARHGIDGITTVAGTLVGLLHDRYEWRPWHRVTLAQTCNR
jgi:hypothetical protein